VAAPATIWLDVFATAPPPATRTTTPANSPPTRSSWCYRSQSRGCRPWPCAYPLEQRGPACGVRDGGARASGGTAPLDQVAHGPAGWVTADEAPASGGVSKSSPQERQKRNSSVRRVSALRTVHNPPWISSGDGRANLDQRLVSRFSRGRDIAQGPPWHGGSDASGISPSVSATCPPSVTTRLTVPV
jgi:hypothetical protein